MPEKETTPEKAEVVVDNGYHAKQREQSGLKLLIANQPV